MNEQQKKDEEIILDELYMYIDGEVLHDVNWYGIVPGTEGRERSLLYVKIDGRCYQIVANPHPHPLED